MATLQEIKQKFTLPLSVLKGLADKPVPTDAGKIAKEKEILLKNIGALNEAEALLEEENKNIEAKVQGALTADDIAKITHFRDKAVADLKAAAQKNPAKMIFMLDAIDDASAAHPACLNDFFLDANKAQGKQAVEELKDKGKAAGRAVNKAGKQVVSWLKDAYNSTVEAVQDLASDLTDDDKDKKKKDKKGENATDKPGFLDKISEFFSNINGTGIAGSVIGGGLFYMLGKMFGEGPVGKIAGLLMAVGGALIGRKFAMSHFGGGDNTGANGQSASSGAGAGATTGNVQVPAGEQTLEELLKKPENAALKQAIETYRNGSDASKTPPTAGNVGTTTPAVQYAQADVADYYNPSLLKNNTSSSKEVDDMYR